MPKLTIQEIMRKPSRTSQALVVSAQPQQTNNTKKKKKGKKKKMGMPRGANMQLIHAVCSNLDPFCVHALNAKLYDENTTRTLTYQSRDIFNVGTDANGLSFMAVTANPTACFYGATIVSNAVSAWGSANNNSFYNSLNGSYGSWRVVSYGFKYFTTQAWTSATGTVTITETGGFSPVGNTGQDVRSLQLGSRSKVFALRDCVATFIARPTGTAANDFVLTTSTDFNDWSCAYIAINGASASATVGSVEVLINYEWIPRNTNGYNPLATPSNPHIPAVMTARANAYGVLDTIKSVKDVVETSNDALSTISSVVSSVGSIAGAASALMSNPTARLAGRAAMGLLMA